VLDSVIATLFETSGLLQHGPVSCTETFTTQMVVTLFKLTYLKS